jgi:hypothetical protein
MSSDAPLLLLGAKQSWATLLLGSDAMLLLAGVLGDVGRCLERP